ncbi:MAG: hypothetical protein AAGJ93_14870 [Bacteroidota bacterium]
MDEIYIKLQEAEDQLRKKNAHLISINNTYPYTDEDMDHFLDTLPFDDSDPDSELLIQMKGIRKLLLSNPTISDADILTILGDFEESLTKFLLLVFADEKLDFYFVLHLYVVRKIKLILDRTITKAELVNLYWLLRSGQIDATIIPPSIVAKYKTFITSPDPGTAYWLTKLLYLDGYKDELRPLLESNLKGHSDWQIQVFSAQRLKQEEQISKLSNVKWKVKPDVEAALRYAVLDKRDEE